LEGSWENGTIFTVGVKNGQIKINGKPTVKQEIFA